MPPPVSGGHVAAPQNMPQQQQLHTFPVKHEFQNLQDLHVNQLKIIGDKIQALPNSTAVLSQPTSFQSLAHGGLVSSVSAPKPEAPPTMMQGLAQAHNLDRLAQQMSTNLPSTQLQHRDVMPSTSQQRADVITQLLSGRATSSGGGTATSSFVSNTSGLAQMNAQTYGQPLAQAITSALLAHQMTAQQMPDQQITNQQITTG